MLKNWNVRRILSYFLVAVIAAGTATLVCLAMNPHQEPQKLQQLEELIQEKFVAESDRTAMEDAAAAAMISSLGDRWSHYISASAYQSYVEQQNNAYVGVGITIDLSREGPGMYVSQVAEGGSAGEEGILPGDLVIAVDGQDITAMDSTQARSLIAGQAGTKVCLTVNRDGEELTFELERREIQTQVARGILLDGGVGLVTIENFETRCYQETVEAIESLLSQGATALIFDVRNNPGGFVSELVDLLDYLLPEGDLFRSEYYDGRTTLDTSNAACLEMPMAVLVNGSSYSAAEFFAAALREYDWAVVVGENTCGKGYFQQTYRLSDGSAVALSVGRYFTPKGVCLADVGGLVPDVSVEVDGETAASIRADSLAPEADPQLQAAIQALLGKNGTEN